MADLRTRALSALRKGAGRGGWMRESVWTVLDQGLFAGSNFAVNVLLARWLLPEAYGAFAVAFMVFLAVGVVHTGLFVEPMLVFGADRFRSRVGPYLRVLFAGHVRFALVAGALMALSAAGVFWVGQSPTLAASLLAFGVGQVAILATWMLRRACYVVSRPDWAVGAGTLYLVLVVGGAFTLNAFGSLSAPSGVALMVLGAACSGALLWRKLEVPIRRPRDATLSDSARGAHTDYGRWSASTGILEWAHSAVPYLALPFFIGLEASGELRALYNLAMPGLHAFSALSLMVVPVFVRARVAGRLRSTAMRVGGGLLALSLLYALVVLGLGRPATEALYRGQYALSGAELILLALVPIPSALSGLLMAVLRSQERPAAVFRARASAVGAAVTVGLWLTARLGVAGALASDMLALLVEGAVLAKSLVRPRPTAPSTMPDVLDRPPRTRLRVLHSSFACLPGWGSEPGIGWNMARETARHHDVWVLTYTGFREQIEEALARDPVPGLHFVYHRLPFEDDKYAVRGAFRSGLAEQVHYYLWQTTAARVARRLHAEVGFDVVHHLTYGKYWMPSAVARLGVPFVWGPVGGGESAPRPFYGAMSAASRRYERKRDLARALFERFPSVRRTARDADLAFATTEESASRMRAVGARGVHVRSAIGLTQDVIDRLGAVPPVGEGPARFLMIGRLIPFKGFGFGIAAFAEAVASGGDGMESAELWVLGDGPLRPELEATAARLGVADRVQFTGAVPREDVLAHLADARALLHPSLHDSGGYVCLEALAAGRPVLGFALGGTVVHVPPGAGVLVEATEVAASVRSLAEAIREVGAYPAHARTMGEAGRSGVGAYAWPRKATRVAAEYAALLGLVHTDTEAAFDISEAP